MFEKCKQAPYRVDRRTVKRWGKYPPIDGSNALNWTVRASGTYSPHSVMSRVLTEAKILQHTKIRKRCLGRGRMG
jgi:hypothetical protein